MIEKSLAISGLSKYAVEVYSGVVLTSSHGSERNVLIRFLRQKELLLLLKTLAACEHRDVSSSDPGNGNGGDGSGPSWAKLKGRAHSILETLHSLLSVPSFVAVTQELIRHEVQYELVMILMSAGVWPF